MPIHPRPAPRPLGSRLGSRHCQKLPRRPKARCFLRRLLRQHQMSQQRLNVQRAPKCLHYIAKCTRCELMLQRKSGKLLRRRNVSKTCHCPLCLEDQSEVLGRSHAFARGNISRLVDMMLYNRKQGHLFCGHGRVSLSQLSLCADHGQELHAS